MASRVRRTTSGPIPLSSGDGYGRRSVPGAAAMVTERRTRRWSQTRRVAFHRVKNGIYDPYTFFHVVEELASLKPNQPFTSAEFAEYLNDNREYLYWDPVTVGRVLNDLRENFEEANRGERMQPIVAQRYWDGMFYEVTDHPEARAALLNLLDDLNDASQNLYEQEADGKAPARLTSPLASCPSLIRVYDEAV